MDINYVRFLLAAYCSISPVNGKLYREKKKPLQDTEIAKLLKMPVDEWMQIKELVLENCFIKDDEGVIALHPVIQESMIELSKSIDNVSSYAQDIIDRIQIDFERKLTPHQILIERYKRIKGYADIPDWDKRNYKVVVRAATATIKKIGFEKAVLIMDWLEQSRKDGKRRWWDMHSILKFYDLWWKITRQTDDGYVDSGQQMLNKYR